MRIMLVEDDQAIAALVARALCRDGFAVDPLASCSLALEAARSFPYDLVILDRMLPDGDGADLVARLAPLLPDARYLMLSALGAAEERVHGLDRGADDYLAKPFAIDELRARVRALLRRAVVGQDAVWQLGALRFRPGHRCFETGTGPLDLTRRELGLLEVLMRSAGRVVLRETLLEAVYGFAEDVGPTAIESSLSRLRTRLDRAGTGVVIEAVRGVGYCLRAIEP